MRESKIKNLFSLKNKIIIITGGLGFLGQQHIEAVIEAGGIPIALDNNENNLKKIKQLIFLRYKKNFDYFKCDISNEKKVKNICNKIFKKYQKIDGLINNASVNYNSNNIKLKSFEHFNLKNWKKDLSVGLTGTFLCIKYFGEKINLNKDGGSIINISSDLGIISPDQRLYNNNKKNINIKPVSYSVVKHGIIGFTKFFSTYYKNKKVRVNTLCPGGVFSNNDKSFLKKIKKLIPLNRMAKSGEYKGSIIYLLSSASSYMNGSNLIVDGGRTAW